jgi:hypothetical protein
MSLIILMAVGSLNPFPVGCPEVSGATSDPYGCLLPPETFTWEVCTCEATPKSRPQCHDLTGINQTASSTCLYWPAPVEIPGTANNGVY